MLGAQIADSQGPTASVDPEILTLNRAEELSERELDVLRLIGIGRSNKQIALELAITPNTVKTHVSSILGKLGLESRTQAALYMPCLATSPGKRTPLAGPGGKTRHVQRRLRSTLETQLA